jgi:hypothetical protein
MWSSTEKSAAARIRHLLADVDGTLVTKEKILTERARAAVFALRATGIGFSITSGRPPKGMSMLIEPLKIDTPIAGFNGGEWTEPDLTPIESRILPRDIADQTVKMMLDDGLDVWVYSGGDWLVRDKTAPHVAREEWTVKFPPKIVQDFGAALDNAVKIVGCSDDEPRIEGTEKKVQEALAGRASAARSQPYYLDVTHKQANKGSVVEDIVKRTGLDPRQIATIGDQPNDIEMFRKSGLSIAMGNSSDFVQKHANQVTESSEAEGFAIAVEKYILGAG